MNPANIAENEENIKIINKAIYFRGYEIPIQISSADMVDKIANWHYPNTIKTKEKEVEDAKIPSMVSSFYGYMVQYKAIPTEYHFIIHYLKRKSKKILNRHTYFAPSFSISQQTKSLDDLLISPDASLISFENERGLQTLPLGPFIGRLHRTYASILRDFHMQQALTDSKLFKNVIYSTLNDLDNIDYMLECKSGTRLKIGNIQYTASAIKHAKEKHLRHEYTHKPDYYFALKNGDQTVLPELDNMFVIDVSSRTKGSDKYNLFNEKIYIDKIKEIIQKRREF